MCVCVCVCVRACVCVCVGMCERFSVYVLYAIGVYVCTYVVLVSELLFYSQYTVLCVSNVYTCAGCPEEERAATTSVIISQY